MAALVRQSWKSTYTRSIGVHEVQNPCSNQTWSEVLLQANPATKSHAEQGSFDTFLPQAILAELQQTKYDAHRCSRTAVQEQPRVAFLCLMLQQIDRGGKGPRQAVPSARS